jgi:hypothetical protein
MNSLSNLSSRLTGKWEGLYAPLRSALKNAKRQMPKAKQISIFEAEMFKSMELVWHLASGIWRLGLACRGTQSFPPN